MGAAMDMDVSMEDMADTTERGALMLRLRPMLSLAMDTTAVDTDMVATDTDVSMVDTSDTMERGALMPRLSLDMNIMAVDMDMAVMVMDVSMVDTADTTDKFHLFLIPLQQHS